MNIKFKLIVLATALASAIPLLAHHSFAAEFDASHAIRLTGTLSKVDWSNPHSYFYIDVKDDKGQVVRWGCEAGGPNALTRRGWKKSDLKLGDTLIIDGYPARDGSALMDARRVTFPDGKSLYGGSAGDGGPGDTPDAR
jgi:hypothetical protein